MIVVVSRQRRHFSLNRSLRIGITSLSSSYRSYIVGLIATVSCCMLSSMAMSLSSASVPTKSRRTLVVIGGGIQGASVAYYLAQQQHQQGSKDNIIILESKMPASAASGKGGGFMARSWGDGSPTQRLHEIAFDLFDKELSTRLPLTSYRKLPVLSVTPGTKPAIQQAKSAAVSSILPNWLNGKVGGISVLGSGQDTAQVTPAEVVEKMLEAVADRVQVVLGTCTGITSEVIDDTTSTTPQERRITGVTYLPRSNNDNDTSSSITPLTLAADVVCISAGPWSCAAEAWLDGAVQLPMEGIKSTSIVWRPPQDNPNAVVDATALFCGEDHRYGTHLEVYPRPDGTIYICGIGGSDYITKQQLQEGAFREECLANEARVNAAVQSFHAMSEQYQAKGELDRVQACMRPCPPDAMPYMERVPGYQGAYINAGHNCWGIAWAPACGKAMAQLILEGECKLLDLTPFDPARFTPAEAGRGGRGRKQRGTSVGEQW